jgi:transcriptional regulator with XRE-family HTH domain
MNENEIKDIIKNRRLELGLTMLDIAKAVGVSEATVSRWESGDIDNMKRNRIAALSKVLKLSPNIIMGLKDEKDFKLGSLLDTTDDRLIQAINDMYNMTEEQREQLYKFIIIIKSNILN